MRIPITPLVLLITAGALSACDKAVPDAPRPVAGQAMPGTAPTTGIDPPVPPADSVLTPASPQPADASAGRTNKSMSRAQESSAMPMPGQVNDHSAPLSPARGASTPK